MRKVFLLVVAIIAVVLMCGAQTDQKVWTQFEGCVGSNAQGCFFFMQDKETGTRCYAFRADYHEGAAISCVK